MEIIFQLSSSPVMYSFLTKLYFRSLPLYTDSIFPKAMCGKSPNPYDCYLLLSKALQTRNIFSSLTVNLFIDFRLSIA